MTLCAFRWTIWIQIISAHPLYVFIYVCVCALHDIKWVVSSQQKLDTKTLGLNLNCHLINNTVLCFDRNIPEWPAAFDLINSSWIRSAVPFERIAYCSCWLGCDWCAAAFWLLYSPLPRNHQNSPHELSSAHSKASRGEDTNQSNANSQQAPVPSPQKGE